jgi:hypothetical protein
MPSSSRLEMGHSQGLRVCHLHIYVLNFSSGYLSYNDNWEIFVSVPNKNFNPTQEGYSVKKVYEAYFEERKCSTLFYTIPLLRGVEKHFTDKIKYFQMVLLIKVSC